MRYNYGMLIHLIRNDRITLPDGTAYALAKPVNDLLGLRDDARYLAWLEAEWGDLSPSKADASRMLGRRQKTAPLSHLPADLAEIAIGAHGGTVDYARLAPLLSQVEYRSGSLGAPPRFEVPSLAVLAVWALVRQLERGDPLVRCVSCDKPFFPRLAATDQPYVVLTEDGKPAWYCQRPAPGLTITCADVYAHDRFSRERKDWSREYRKVMARKLRGTVSEEDFRAWKSGSGPGERGKDWIPFDEWRAAGR